VSLPSRRSKRRIILQMSNHGVFTFSELSRRCVVGAQREAHRAARIVFDVSKHVGSRPT
jgi:hypothetical protein